MTTYTWDAVSTVVITALAPIISFLDSLGFIGEITHVVKTPVWVGCRADPHGRLPGHGIDYFQVHDLFVPGLPLLLHPLPSAQQARQALLLLHRGLLAGAVDLWP
eukprot:scaffold967_cov173-Ochromonas_danica.AAC.25